MREREGLGRWIMVMRACNGDVGVWLMSRPLEGVVRAELLQTLEQGMAGKAVSVAVSGRVIALARGGDELDVWEWEGEEGGRWVKMGSRVRVSGGNITGLAVMASLRRAYVLAATPGGVFFVRGAQLGLGGALDRQDSVDTHVRCRGEVDRSCNQHHADYVQEWFGLASTSPLLPLLLLCPFLVRIYLPRLLSIPSLPPLSLSTARRISLVMILALFSFSIWEIIHEPTFLNDWPAHIHHVEQFLEVR